MIFNHKVRGVIIAVGTLEMIVGPFFLYGLICLPFGFWVNLEGGYSRGVSFSPSSLPMDSLLRGFFFFYIFVFNVLGLTNSWVPLTCWPILVILLRFRVWASTIFR